MHCGEIKMIPHFFWDEHEEVDTHLSAHLGHYARGHGYNHTQIHAADTDAIVLQKLCIEKEKNSLSQNNFDDK